MNGESVSRLRGSNRVTQRRRPSARNARQIWQATESPAGAREREQQPLSTLAVLTRESSASSYVKETTRLFPLGSTVVDRGSGSLTAQASLSTYRSIAVLFSSFAAPHAIRTSLSRTELTADPHPFFIPYCSVGYGPVDRA